MKFIALLLVLGAPCLSALGQSSPADGASPVSSPVKPVMPSGPLLNPPSNFSTWEVAYTYPEDRPKPAADAAPPKPPAPGASLRPRKIVTTKTGRIVREELTDLRNHQTELWFDGPVQYQKPDGGATWFQSSGLSNGNGGTDNSYRPLPTSGYRALDWISPDAYAGSIPYGGDRRCLVFTPGGYRKLDLSVGAKLEQRLAAVDTIAYIDADTRLPVAVRTSAETRTYRFGPPPAEMQRLPADLAEQIRKGNEGRARLEMPAARPY